MQATSSGRWLAWTLAIVLGLANAAGYVFDLYQKFWWFDRVLHASTILAITLWLGVLVWGKALRPGHRLLAFLLVSCAGVAVGAIWEVAEWAFDQLASGDVIKGKYDTVLDIIMDTAGALLAGWLTLAFLRPEEPADASLQPILHASR